MILAFTKNIFICGKYRPSDFEQKILSDSKIHTIRDDPKNRWKEGNKIHFATGVRSSKYNCFKEGICSGVQTIKIINSSEYMNDAKIFVDDRELLMDEKIELVHNDGFSCLVEFFMYFDADFEGKLIHWTDKRY